MTLEQLANLSADEWDKISDVELEEICRPFFPITRPVPVVGDNKETNAIPPKVKQEHSQMIAAAKAAGVDLALIMAPVKFSRGGRR